MKERQEARKNRGSTIDVFFSDRLEKSDLSPKLQETIRRKIESGEDEGVDRDDFLKLLGRASQEEQSDPED